MSQRPMIATLVPTFAAAAVLIGCTTRAEPPKLPLGKPSASAEAESPARAALSPQAKTALDAGNAAFLAKKYDEALKQYRVAAKAAPSDVAPFYGIYMAADKLGQTALRDSASKLIAVESGSSNPMFTDSTLRAAHTAANTKGK